MNYDKDEDIDEPFVTMLLIASLCFGCALSLPWHALLNVLTFALGFGLYIPTKKVCHGTFEPFGLIQIKIIFLG